MCNCININGNMCNQVNVECVCVCVCVCAPRSLWLKPAVPFVTYTVNNNGKPTYFLLLIALTFVGWLCSRPHRLLQDGRIGGSPV